MSKAREYALRRKYNLTLEKYNGILVKQDHKCGVCRKPREAFTTNFSVDHDHKTGEIRGLLCAYCNRYVIGRHRDADLFERAAAYLRGPFVGIFANKIKRKRKKKNNTKRKRRT